VASNILAFYGRNELTGGHSSCFMLLRSLVKDQKIRVATSSSPNYNS